MLGTAGLQGLRIDCIVGIYEHEREKPQSVIIDVDVDYDFAAASGSDGISNAVDYDDIARMVTNLAQRKAFHLIETMAEETAQMLFDKLPVAQKIRLEIRKPAAVPVAAYAFVRAERTRP